jgi:ornithine lipid hydroxylase
MKSAWPREVCSRVLFPMTVALVLGAFLALRERGWSVQGLVAGLSGLVVLELLVAERLLPYRPQWNRSQGDARADLTHLAVNGIAGPPLYGLVVQAACIPVAAWAGRSPGMSLWPAHWPVLLQLVLALVVSEMSLYWWHRLSHMLGVLWRFHSVHHSAERLYWVNAARFHPVDSFLSYAAQFAPLVALGCPEPALALFALFTAVHGLFRHSNVDVRLGPMNRVFSMAELHRWHHARDPAVSDHNYGANLILWDLVFGTWHGPQGPGPPELGLGAGPQVPRDYLCQLAHPFRSGRQGSAPHEET